MEDNVLPYQIFFLEAAANVSRRIATGEKKGNDISETNWRFLSNVLTLIWFEGNYASEKNEMGIINFSYVRRMKYCNLGGLNLWFFTIY